MVLKFRLGDSVYLKKRHPCGEFRWKVMRLGDEIGLECFGCGRMNSFSRTQLGNRVKEIESVSSADEVRR